MEEVWKVIPGFEGYSASSEGRIRNDKTGNVLKANKKEDGYVHIKLTSRKKSMSKLVHQVVAMAFLPNPEAHPEINHKNSIRSDNRVENLEWISKEREPCTTATKAQGGVEWQSDCCLEV